MSKIKATSPMVAPRMVTKGWVCKNINIIYIIIFFACKFFSSSAV